MTECGPASTVEPVTGRPPLAQARSPTHCTAHCHRHSATVTPSAPHARPLTGLAPPRTASMTSMHPRARRASPCCCRSAVHALLLLEVYSWSLMQPGFPGAAGRCPCASSTRRRRRSRQEGGAEAAAAQVARPSRPRPPSRPKRRNRRGTAAAAAARAAEAQAAAARSNRSSAPRRGQERGAARDPPAQRSRQPRRPADGEEAATPRRAKKRRAEKVAKAGAGAEAGQARRRARRRPAAAATAAAGRRPCPASTASCPTRCAWPRKATASQPDAPETGEQVAQADQAAPPAAARLGRSLDPVLRTRSARSTSCPTCSEGDITLLNTKAEVFAPFVRRVAIRVFQNF